jgi:hypothetical protein
MVAEGSFPWSRVKEKKLEIASQEGVKLRREWERTHLRTFCAEEKRARFGSGRRSSNPAGIGDSRGGYAEYLVGNDVVVGRRGSHLRTFCVEEKRGHIWLRAAVVEPGGERRQRRRQRRGIC